MNKNQNAPMPADKGLQRFSKGVNDKYEESLFETFPMMEAMGREPKTGIAIPSEAAVEQAKEWVDNGSKL